MKTELNEQVVRLTDMISIQDFEKISVKYKEKLNLSKPNGFVTYLKKDKILAFKCKVCWIKDYLKIKAIKIKSSLL